MKSLYSLLNIIVIFMLFLSESPAKETECIIAANRLSGNYVAITQKRFLHLSASIIGYPGTLLYSLPLNESDSKMEKNFYYVESLTSDCNSWSMQWRDDADTQIVMLANLPIQANKHCKNNMICGYFDAILEWYPQNDGISDHESIRFIPTEVAWFNGMGIDMPVIEVRKYIEQTTHAICSRLLDSQQQEMFKQCMAGFSGQKVNAEY